MAEDQKKFYLLYNNKSQEKLLTSATSEEQIQEESQYYNEGNWFAYDDCNNLLANEKAVTGIKFPKEPKARERYNSGNQSKKSDFKYLT